MNTTIDQTRPSPYERNRIWLGDARISRPEELPDGLTINFHDRSVGNEVRLAAAGSWRGVVVDLTAAVDCVVDVGAIRVNFGGLRISFVSNDGRCSTKVRVSVGDGCTFNGSTHIIGPLTPGLAVTVGKGCLLASGISIRGSSHHGLWDIESGELLNVEQGIEIGDRVWIGDQVVVLNKAAIGSGSVVAARSVVNKPLRDSNSLIAGTPASIKRVGVAWTPDFPRDNGETRRAVGETADSR